ncbi:MAG: DUF3298 domain-containing protein [Polyangiaceae bacterium]|nr:DUF3298 domain-containing protein [Polyangiaceae bacterium]
MVQRLGAVAGLAASAALGAGCAARTGPSVADVPVAAPAARGSEAEDPDEHAGLAALELAARPARKGAFARARGGAVGERRVAFSGDLAFEHRYPHFAGLPFAASLNAALDAEADAALRWALGQLPDSRASAREGGEREGGAREGGAFEGGAFEYGDACRTAGLGPGFASLVCDGRSYIGGAHAEVGRYGVVYLVEGDARDRVRRVELDDLLRDPPAGRRRLSALVLPRLARAGASLVTSGEVTDVGAALATPAVGRAGLRFFFPPYLVGSFAEGTYEALVRLDEVRDLLRSPDALVPGPAGLAARAQRD